MVVNSFLIKKNRPLKARKGRINSVFSSDIVVLFFTLIVLFNYNYTDNLAPGLLTSSIQLAILWFIFRILFFLLPLLSRYITYIILVIGLIEAIWGLGQLYGFFSSKHALFKTTGSFFNPGPYGGFIALMFPLTLHFWLISRKKNKILEYLFLAAGIILLLVFPATLSRTAWIAAIIGCALVLFFDTSVIAKLKYLRKQHPKKVILLVATITVLFMGGIYGVFHIKKDSANGRLFMWKIAALAIKESPVQGVGLGGFPAAYANAQIDYFKNGKGSETEKLVAGSPEYAFNEYLKIFLEQGVFGGILFLLFTFLIIRSGIKNKQTGAAGSFMALSVFAFASYPYYLWEFLIMWILLGTVCVSAKDKSTNDAFSVKSKRKTYILGVLSLCALVSISFICLKHQQPYYHAKKEWKKLRPLYTMKAYHNIVEDYKQLYRRLNYNPKFVFEYAVALNATKQYEKADNALSRGLLISCDPMFYNVKGRNYHEMGKFNQAKACYINSTHLLPERIYPYYLLTKLYADSANYQPEKMREAAYAVLEKEPKIHSMAINEMRDEVRKILKEKKGTNESK